MESGKIGASLGMHHLPAISKDVNNAGLGVHSAKIRN